MRNFSCASKLLAQFLAAKLSDPLRLPPSPESSLPKRGREVAGAGPHLAAEDRDRHLQPLLRVEGVQRDLGRFASTSVFEVEQLSPFERSLKLLGCHV